MMCQRCKGVGLTNVERDDVCSICGGSGIDDRPPNYRQLLILLATEHGVITEREASGLLDLDAGDIVSVREMRDRAVAEAELIITESRFQR